MTLADLYETHEAMVQRYAHSLTHDTDRADDLVQDTFLRAMNHLPLLALLNEYQQRAWLRRTVKNLFLDEQRTHRRQALLLEQLGQERMFTTAENNEEVLSPNPFTLVPDDVRELFEKRYLLGMNSSEIAEELGVPAATVRSRLHFAMQKIRLYRANYE